MDGRKGAVQACGDAQFLERQVGLLLQQCPELILAAGDPAGLAARTVVLGTHIPHPPPLLEELFDHAQRNPKTAGHHLPGALAGVVGGQDPFAQIQGDRLHLPNLPQPQQMATVLFNTL